MSKGILILIAFILALTVSEGGSGRALPDSSQEPTTAKTLLPQDRGIKLTIATVGSFLGPPTDSYKVGDQIPITIKMTNTSTSPQSVCISSDLYQDLPKLTRNGQPLPFMNWQSYERLNAQKNHVCEEENLPETILLQPNQPKVVDWFVLADSGTSTGAEAWYEPLPAGKYELTIQRRLACCDGPLVESNKISFEVLPRG